MTWWQQLIFGICCGVVAFNILWWGTWRWTLLGTFDN